MNKKFIERLTEFLESEATDYGLEYNYEYDSDCEWCDVQIKLEHRPEKKCTVQIRYNEEKDDLSFEMYEDNWETIREFDHTVKYFWMYVAPKIWNN